MNESQCGLAARSLFNVKPFGFERAAKGCRVGDLTHRALVACAELVTRQVLAESMRLFPPAWVLERMTVEPFDAGGYTIRPGTTVLAKPVSAAVSAAVRPSASSRLAARSRRWRW